MGRAGVGRRGAGVQVTSRMTWTVSARTEVGRARETRHGRLWPLPAAGRVVSAALLRALLRAARSRPGSRHARRR
ncbi:hypothetical protein [Streptomyces sp. NPDC046805]|uniref:hypothetical protein n=1 Tax=Streptomyces sp. NPDC046805 TaxID=3155134 RepID=UPI0033E7A64C